MGPGFSPKMAVKSLTSEQIVRINQLFRQAKFDDPSGDVSYLSSFIVLLSFSDLIVRLPYCLLAFFCFSLHNWHVTKKLFSVS